MFGVIHGTIFAQTPTHYLIQAQSKNYQHRLHSQPNKGPFSVFLFCDDALGSNIGVILTEPGGGSCINAYISFSMGIFHDE